MYEFEKARPGRHTGSYVNMKIETHLHSSQTSRCGRLPDENIELEKYFLTVKIMARAIEYLAGKD